VCLAKAVVLFYSLLLCTLQEHAPDFITVDKLDSAIEAALNSRVVDSFAIDVDGNRHIEQPDGSTVMRLRTELSKLTDGT